MTLAQAVNAARIGEPEGIAMLQKYTMPGVWLAAVVLGCAKPDEAAAAIYQNAEESFVSLRSPSDLRVCLGKQMVPILLEQASEQGLPIHGLPTETAQAYAIISSLPLEQRMALLLMCADGCSAPQAAEILGCAEIEVKRAVRTARQTTAARMKELGCTANCNTGWLIVQFTCLRELLNEQTAAQREEILTCLRTGETYIGQPETIPDIQPVAEQTIMQEERMEPKAAEAASEEEFQVEEQPKNEEKGGFFSKLFRSRRFG